VSSTFVTLDYLLVGHKKENSQPASKGKAFVEMPGILGKKENAFGAAFPARPSAVHRLIALPIVEISNYVFV